MSKGADIQNIYPLTPMQEGMLFHHLLEKERDAYVLQTVIAIEGRLERNLLERAFNILIERYELLRSVFIHKSIQKPRQITLRKRVFHLQWDDIVSLPPEERRRRLDEVRLEERRKGFDLSKDFLMRVRVIQESPRTFTFVWSFHHILMDGWCFGLIVSDLLEIYQALLHKRPSELRPVFPYANYIKWLDRRNREAAADYWRNYLEDYQGLAALPTFGKTREDSGAPMRENHFEIPRELTERLTDLAARHGTTLNTLFQALWSLCLQTYTNASDVVFGSVVSGRPPEVPGIETMVGLFINTLPVRVRTREETTFSDIVRDLHQGARESDPFAYFPLAEIQNLSELRQPLFDHILVFENYPLDKGIRDLSLSHSLGFSITNVETVEQTHYDLTVIVNPGEALRIKMVYNPAVHDPAFIARMEGHCRVLLRRVLEDPGVRVRDLSLLTEEEHGLLAEFNRTAAPYPSDKTVHALFEAQVRRTPHHSALVFEGRDLTYLEVNRRANALASVLRAKGVAPDSITAIMMDRSAEMIVGVLAVLKAGGAFLPIDPEYPEDRIAYMLEDSASALLLTKPHFARRAKFSGEVLDAEDPALYEGPEDDPPPAAGPRSLFYVIYTSGTTGKPKAVMLEHRNLVNLVAYEHALTPVDFSGRVMNFVTISFDVCYQEIFSTLLAGGRLFIVPDEIKKDVNRLLRFLREHAIQVAFFPTSYLIYLTGEPEFLRRLSESLKHLITAGEQLVVRGDLRNVLKERGITLHNHYGPSETHVATAWSMDPAGEIPDLPPIGRPISNTRVHIMNHHAFKPVGVDGELYIAGDCVGRGYWRRPELTAERFLPDPFVPGERMYKTGDRARWLPDGTLEYRGRMDNQVKIRGFRVEVGEVESRLMAHPGVKDAAVVVKTDAEGIKYLCAYVAGGTAIPAAELRTFMAAELPDFMIPSYFVHLEKMPLRPSGKVDWSRLPEPQAVIGADRPHVPPSSLHEQKLVRIWSEILNVERIGVRDDFFDLGGHSLKAVSMVSRVGKEFGVDLPLREIFLHPTIEAIARYVQRTAESDYAGIEPVEQREHYPLSSAQRRLFLLQQFEPGGTGYNMPAALTAEGVVDCAKLRVAMEDLLRRHETLRTSFHVVDGVPVQKIHPEVPFDLPLLSGQGLTPEEIFRRFIRPFDMTRPPLIRAALVRMDGARHLLIMDMHHIVSDGASIGIIGRELLDLYQGRTLPSLPVQYKAFAVWQNEFLKTEKVLRQGEYWRAEYGDTPPVLNLPADFPRPPLQSFEGDELEFRIDRGTTEACRAVGRENGATLYMVLLALFKVLLAKYTGQDDLVVGTPVAGRRHSDLEPVIGMFVNTLAIRTQPKGNLTFREFLLHVRDKTLKAFDFQDYQFEDLVERLSLKRDLSRNPLFDVMFALRNAERESLEIPGLKLTPHPLQAGISKFDLTLGLVEDSDGLDGGLEFGTRLFARATMERLIGHFQKLIRDAIADPDLRLADLDILTEAERREVLAFNPPPAPCPGETGLPALFQVQVRKTPDRVAVVFEGKSWTYGEVNAKANRLAHTLRQSGARPDAIIGLMTDPSPAMVTGILGILKSGAAYLPLDPDSPPDRIAYMLEAINSNLLLTQTPYLRQVPFSGRVLDLEDESAYAAENGDPAPVNAPNHLAYVIFTSGSTGRPKGVLAEHRNIVVYTDAFQREFHVGEGDAFLHLAPYTFDAFVEEFYPVLLSGAALVIPNKREIKDAGRLLALMGDYGVTHLTCSPLLLNELNKLPPVPSVRVYISGADVLKDEHISNLRRSGAVYNTYGPTETTVCATYHRITDRLHANIPIGKPIAHYRVYVCNAAMQLVPVGIPGEICIAGDGAARGYLNDPDLTGRKFLTDPFHGEGRMYRTGDLGRWRPDGSLEFLGRIDQQIKLRGFRIEPGEIEARILELDAVHEAVVDLKTDDSGAGVLCAYLVTDREWTVEELRKALSGALPEYMIPTYFLPMERFPKTSAGKVDRRALPPPSLSLKLGTEYVEPATATERGLAEIWKEVLALEQVGVHDPFFALGGHSLKALQVLNLIQKQFRVEVGLHTLFQNATIAQLAKVVESAQAVEHAVIEKLPEREAYDLSYAQKRLWILHQLEPESAAYNMPGRLTLPGGSDEPARIREVLAFLVERHEALRTRFLLKDGEPMQVVARETVVTLPVEDLTGLPPDEREFRREQLFQEFAEAPFDLQSPPLFRAMLVRPAPDLWDFNFVIHHIISDGWSLEVLKKEFFAVRVAMGAGKALELEPLPIQYKDFAAWQNTLLEQSKKMREAKAFWSRELSGELPLLDLPRDRPFSGLKDRKSAAYRIVVGEAVLKKLHALAAARRSSLFMVLLAGFEAWLSVLTGQRDLAIGVAAGGREHEALGNVMGFFINTVVHRETVDPNESFSVLLDRVSAHTLKVLEYQTYPLELILDELKVPFPTLSVFINMLNMEQGANEALEDHEPRHTASVQEAKFDMVFYLADYLDGLEISCHYWTGLFDPATVEYIVGQYAEFLKKAAEAPEKRILEHRKTADRKKLKR